MIDAWQRAWGLLLISACFHPSYDHPACGRNGECPAGFTCNAQLICDNGSSAMDAPALDASSSIDSVPGIACYGPSGAWRVCLGSTPTATTSVPSTIDTDTSSLCLPIQPVGWTLSQPEACFIVGKTVSVKATVVHGHRPLVVVAQDGITVTSLLDVASHRADTGTARSSSACKPFQRSAVVGGGGQNPGGGGGAGGSFMTRAGNGGGGDDGRNLGGQAADADASAPVLLRGGCAGQAGGGSPMDDAGGGGGAMYLVAGNQIGITGAINASGAGGAGASNTAGGSGGGSGGMIVLYAPSVTTTATTILLANGGGGGGGGGGTSPSFTGAAGKDPVVMIPVMPAAGGLGGGNAGDGAAGFPATTVDATTNGNPGEGGGGGGGGAGYIQTNQSLGAATVSPVARISS